MPLRSAYVFDHLPELGALASLRPLGLVTDIDGTISEIAPSPEEAFVTPSMRDKLRRLVPQVAVLAALSGRPAEQAQRMVGVDGMVYVGNHGLEYLTPQGTEILPEARPYLPMVASILSSLRSELHLEGVRLEDKLLSLAVHYRASPRPTEARAAILDALHRLPDLQLMRIVEGKMVVELRPPVEANKGAAIEAIASRYGLAATIYLGDDQTDLDAFRALRRLDGRAASIAVAGIETPREVVEAADYLVRSVMEVERFLSWLLQWLRP